jgi:hypothetical protein
MMEQRTTTTTQERIQRSRRISPETGSRTRYSAINNSRDTRPKRCKKQNFGNGSGKENSDATKIMPHMD